MNKKILIVVTNHDLYEATKEPTGLWFGELIHFYHVMEEAGVAMDISSPKGGAIPIDPFSLTDRILDKVSKKYYEDDAFLKKLNNSLNLEELNAADYDAIYFTGGHGTMWDFPDSKKIQELGQGIYEQGGIVSAVCHGVGALLNIKKNDGERIIAGKKVTGYSNNEEKIMNALEKIPYQLETSLKEAGAEYKKALIPFVSYTVVDGRVITGQNPQSTQEVAEKVLKALSKVK
jgi:putative intracellular protease/amidase